MNHLFAPLHLVIQEWADLSQCGPSRALRSSEKVGSLPLRKKKPQETSLSLPGYEHGIMQNRLPSAAVLQPVRNTGLKITLILVLQRISALDSGTQVSEKSESSMALLSYRTRAIQE